MTRRRTPQEAAERAPAEARLTDKELALLELLSQGHTIEAIAAQRGRAVGTVRTQARELYRKLGAASAAHAVGEGYRRGLLHVDPEAAKIQEKAVDLVAAGRARAEYVRLHLASGLAKKAREQTGVKVERVAELCGVPVQSVHYWERTLNPPSTEGALNAYCELLRVMIESSLRPDPLLSFLK